MGEAIEIFTATGCTACARAKEELKQRGLRFHEVDVNTVDGMAEFNFHCGGSTELPLLVWREAAYANVDALVEAMGEDSGGTDDPRRAA